MFISKGKRILRRKRKPDPLMVHRVVAYRIDSAQCSIIVCCVFDMSRWFASVQFSQFVLEGMN